MRTTILTAVMACVLVARKPPLCSSKRTSKDWSKMNLDELAKQWEEGDDEEELKTEQQAAFEALERRKKMAAEAQEAFDPSSLSQMKAAEIGAIAAGQKDATGPAMMFAQVTGGGFDGEEGEALSKEQTSDVGGRLQQLAKLGGLEVSAYAIDPGSVLISTQKGWEGKEILDFLLSRPEVNKVTWNSQEFTPPVDNDEL